MEKNDTIYGADKGCDPKTDAQNSATELVMKRLLECHRRTIAAQDAGEC